MSVVIRLARVGKRRLALYRVVVVDKKQKRDSMPLEILGSYNPKGSLQINRNRLVHWQTHGASVSQTVRRLLANA